MPTIRQKKLAQAIVANLVTEKPRNKTQLLESSGYSTVSAKASAKDLMERPGVQKELHELGFSVDNAKKIIGAILNANTVYEMVTPENQIRAAQEVFKVTGEYASEKHTNLNINVTPIYGGLSRHDSDQEDIQTEEEN